MKYNVKPIETWFKGIKYRSRLEARWAVFFDRMGIPAHYEPQGYITSHGPYLPDFQIGNMLIEIRPEPFYSNADEYGVFAELADSLSFEVLVICGPPAIIGRGPFFGFHIFDYMSRSSGKGAFISSCRKCDAVVVDFCEEDEDEDQCLRINLPTLLGPHSDYCLDRGKSLSGGELTPAIKSAVLAALAERF